MVNQTAADIRLVRTFTGRFGLLLALLLLLLVSTPLIADSWGWNLLLSLIASSVLLTGLYAARPGPRSLAVALVVAFVDLVLGRMAAGTGVQWLLLVQVALWLATTLYVSQTILVLVLKSSRVTMETLQAAICVYLLMGLIWVFLYALIDVSVPGEFQFARKPGFRWADDASRRGEFLNVVFFSYSMLSGVGSGDVTISGPFIRMCACLEAMMGQIYLGVLIARLVGMHVSQSRKDA